LAAAALKRFEAWPGRVESEPVRARPAARRAREAPL